MVQGEPGRSNYITPDSSPDGKFLIFVDTDGAGAGELFVQTMSMSHGLASQVCGHCPALRASSRTRQLFVILSGIAHRRLKRSSSAGHRHCPPLSSPNRCFPVTIPRMSAAAPSLRLLGVEEHHNASRRQTPFETGFRDGIPLGASHAIRSHWFLCLRRSLHGRGAYCTDVLCDDVLLDPEHVFC